MKIGVFDSGVGGLTVSREVIKKNPLTDLVYFGDSKHVPYGNKSEENIIRYSISNTEFLISKKCEMIIIACNTSTAVALPTLKKKFPNFPIIGVIEGGVEAALKKKRTNSDFLKIAIAGTTRTVNSLAYKKSILAKESRAKIYEVACPLLVPLIEEDFKDKEIIKKVLKIYLNSIVDKVEILLLGCTHYPLIKKLIGEVFPKLLIIDSAKTTANYVFQQIKKSSTSFSPFRKNNKIEIFTNDKNEIFERISRKLFPKEKVIFLDT